MALHSVSEPWTESVQQAYVRRSYEEYKLVNGDPVPPPAYYSWSGTRFERSNPVPKHQRNLRHLSCLYRIGLDGGQLRIDYHEFESRVLAGAPEKRGWMINRHRRWIMCPPVYSSWYPRNGAHFRQKVPLGIPEPKELDETEVRRREWRDRKGFHRDRRPHWGIKARGFCRRTGNRALRRWERRMIQKGDYHELADERSTLRLYLDPWDWD